VYQRVCAAIALAVLVRAAMRYSRARTGSGAAASTERPVKSPVAGLSSIVATAATPQSPDDA